MRYALVLLVLLTIAKPQISHAQDYLPHKKDGKFGFVNGSGQWVVNPVFDRVGHFKNKIAYGIIHDSLFLINANNSKRFISGVRNMEIVDSNAFLLQNNEGKWAITDSTLKTISDYKYSKIKMVNGYFLVYQGGLFGVLDKNGKEMLPVENSYGKFIMSNLFLAVVNKEKRFYSVPRDFKLIIKDKFAFFFEPDSLNLFIKNRTGLSMYNLDGDLIYNCKKCDPVAYLNTMVLFKQDEDQIVVDAIDGKVIYQTSDTVNIVAQTQKPGFFFHSGGSKVIAGPHTGIHFDDSLKVTAYTYLDTSNIIFLHNTKFGIYKFTGGFAIEPTYDYVRELSERHVVCGDFSQMDIFRRSDFLKIKSTPAAADVQGTDDNILISFHSKSAVLYNLDSNYKIRDSVRFRELKMLSIGRRSEESGSSLTPGNGAIVSSSKFYFRHNNAIGLLNWNKDADTFFKPMFTSVFQINDSIDIVSLYSPERRILPLKGGGTLSSFAKYGIVNHLSGKFVVPPSLSYIDYSMLNLENCSVIRVVLPNSKFALMDINNFRIVKSSICEYICPPHNGFMRMLIKPVFVVIPFNQFYCAEYRLKQLYIAPVFASGLTLVKTNLNSFIYCRSSAVNIVDIKGSTYFSKEYSENFAFLDEGKYGRFIGYNHRDSMGVVSTGGSVVPFIYDKVTRLSTKDSLFILTKNNTRYGYVNQYGDELTIPVFTRSLKFGDGYAWSSIKDSNFLVDSSGYIEFKFKGVLKTKEYSNGYGAVRKTKGWVLIDEKGQAISEQYFRDVRPFVNNVAAVRTKKGWGIMNSDGQFVLEPQYTEFEAQNAQGIVFRNERKCFFYSLEGTLYSTKKIPGKLFALGDDMFQEKDDNQSRLFYSNGSSFKNGKKYRGEFLNQNDTLILVKETRIKIMDEEGKSKTKIKHYNGIRAVKLGKMKEAVMPRYSVYFKIEITPSMHFLFPEIFNDSIQNFTVRKPNNMNVRLVNKNLPDCYRLNAFMFKAQSNFYLADSAGNLIVSNSFLSMDYFGENYFKVSMRDQNGYLVYGIIDNFGVWVLPPKYDYLDKFSNGVGIYGMKKDYFISNIFGQKITPRELMQLEVVGNYLHLVSEDGAAWWNINGKWVTDFAK